jgi:hypothetical protein
MTESNVETHPAVKAARNVTRQDQSRGDADAERGEVLAQGVADAVLTDALPAYNDHSQNFAGRLMAELKAIRNTKADIAMKQAQLDAELLDAERVEGALAEALRKLQS